MFEKMVGFSEAKIEVEEDIISQKDLNVDQAANKPLHAYSILGAKIGWRESGSQKGRGVYALEDIPKGTQIETAPVIIVAEADVPESGGAPDGYLLDWEPEVEGQEHCMPLGYIMLYNHSRKSNLYLENDYEEMTIAVIAAEDIKKGEELLWDYSCDIWFDED